MYCPLSCVAQEESDKFFNFRNHLIKQYLAGDSRVRGLVDSAPMQTVDTNKKVSVTASDKGRMKLVETYKDEYGCSPSKNNHKVIDTVWKDGTTRKVALIPTGPDDEMECSWDFTNEYNHRTYVEKNSSSRASSSGFSRLHSAQIR